MNQVSRDLEDKLINASTLAKVIMWLSVTSVFAFILIPVIILLYFLVYKSRLSNLKTNETLNSIFSKLKDKTKKELKFIKGHGDSLEQHVASLLMAHKFMTVVLIIVGMIILICIGVIIIYSLLGLEMV
jgi:hypothetical protein